MNSSLVVARSSYECGVGLKNFHATYERVHGWASLLVCIFGSIANGLNIAVLTRREMRSPTNMILTGLAVADLLVMIEYIPYAIHLLYERPRRDTFTYGWAIFVLFHSNFAQVCHTISICLTVTLAIWRYIAVAYPQRNREWCSQERTLLAIAGAYFFCPILCVPVYITTEVTPTVEALDESGEAVNLTGIELHEDNENSTQLNVTNTTLYFVRLTETAKNHGMVTMNLWIYSVVIKLIPCIALTVLSIKLVAVLLEAKRRKKTLTTKVMLTRQPEDRRSTLDSCERTDKMKQSRRKKSVRAIDKEKQADRTTMMLLAVLVLFLLTELPQGVLGLLSVTLGLGFFKTCYVMLGDVIDFLTLINSAINFILYCAMSRQFRMTFDQLFCRWKLFGKWSLVPQHLGDNNGNMATNHTVTQVTQV